MTYQRYLLMLAVIPFAAIWEMNCTIGTLKQSSNLPHDGKKYSTKMLQKKADRQRLPIQSTNLAHDPKEDKNVKGKGRVQQATFQSPRQKDQRRVPIKRIEASFAEARLSAPPPRHSRPSSDFEWLPSSRNVAHVAHSPCRTW